MTGEEALVRIEGTAWLTVELSFASLQAVLTAALPTSPAKNARQRYTPTVLAAKLAEV